MAQLIDAADVARLIPNGATLYCTGMGLAGFAEEVETGPQELRGNEIVVGDGTPRARVIAVLAAVDDTAGKRRMVRLIGLFLIVIAGDVEHVGEADRVGGRRV